jgi:hypothetical protein
MSANMTPVAKQWPPPAVCGQTNEETIDAAWYFVD